MITRVQLANWKAYDELDLELGPGTTFLVAPNGLGKSSFIDAVRWAMDPARSLDVALMRRLAPTASVVVHLAVDGDEVVLRHDLTRTETATMTVRSTATVNGDDVAAIDALQLIGMAWGADPAFLHKTAFLTDRLVVDDDKPDLTSHLMWLHGLDLLRRDQRAALHAADTLENQAKAAKRKTKIDAQDRDAAIQRATDLEAAADRAVLAEQAANDAATAARQALADGRAVVAGREAADSWESAFASIEHDVSRLLGDIKSNGDLDATLEAAEAAARAQFVRESIRRATLADRIEALDASLERLHAAEGYCPVCRRPLDDDSRGNAALAHEADRRTATDELGLLGLDESDSVANELGHLRRRLQSLGPRPNPPTEEVPDLAALVAATESAASTAAIDRAAHVNARAAALSARERADELSGPESGPDAVQLYEQAALLNATAAAFEDTIAEVLRTQIEPLSHQVSRLWEALFPTRPSLAFDDAGDLQRVYDDDGEPLEFRSFSAGEKVIAKILMHVTTLSATTDVPFLWIDEPLEHLDPTSRAFVGETLALLTSRDGISQIVVTTYEDELARRLDEDDDFPVRLRVLRTDPVGV